MENSRENKKVKEVLDTDKDFNIKYEFTPKNYPQFNRVIERGFSTLLGRAKAMLNGEGVYGPMRGKL